MVRRARASILLLLALGCRGAEPPPSAVTSTQPEAAIEPVEPVEPPISADPLVQALALLEPEQVDDHLRVLAVDIGPRLTGSAALAQAEQWAQAEFERWGLVATRERWGELAVGFERGESRGTMIRPERKPLEFGTWAWTPGTPDGAPLRGQALRYPESRKALDAMRPHLKGAWIVLPRERKHERELDERVRKAFAKAKIAGLVLAAGPPESDIITFHGNHRVSPDALPERIEVRLRGDQHAALLELLDAGEFVQLEFAIAQRFVEGPIVQHNVLAELVGERPDERVVLGAHLDSWDGASGAIDNATGVAVVMEAARLLAHASEQLGVRPRRTIAFWLWGGEEQGLLGSKAHAAAQGEQLAGISALLVHDGGTNYVSGLPVTPEQHAAMHAAFAPVMRLAARSELLGERPSLVLELVEALPREPSDSTPYLDAGVPAFYLSQSGSSDYERYHHTQYDQPDAVIDAYQRWSAQVLAIVAWQLANADAPLSRTNMLPLEPRRLGVFLDGTTIKHMGDGTAKQVGMQVGDRIVEVEGVAVEDQDALVAALQRGAAQKRVLVERGDGEAATTLELVLDFSNAPDEGERARRRAERAAAFPLELRPWDEE